MAIAGKFHAGLRFQKAERALSGSFDFRVGDHGRDFTVLAAIRNDDGLASAHGIKGLRKSTLEFPYGHGLPCNGLDSVSNRIIYLSS